jgi:hypothetical protein
VAPKATAQLTWSERPFGRMALRFAAEAGFMVAAAAAATVVAKNVRLFILSSLSFTRVVRAQKVLGHRQGGALVGF